MFVTVSLMRRVACTRLDATRLMFDVKKTKHAPTLVKVYMCAGCVDDHFARRTWLFPGETL